MKYLILCCVIVSICIGCSIPKEIEYNTDVYFDECKNNSGVKSITVKEIPESSDYSVFPYVEVICNK